MKLRSSIASALTVLALVSASGCAVIRGQQSAGAYTDDAAVTTKIKARMAENKQVDATAISVETLNGTVQLSGFAKSSTERAAAEDIATKTSGVKSVRNSIIVRP